MVVFRHQNVGHHHSLLISNKSFENVANFKQRRATVTNQNWIHEQIKSRLSSGSACYYSVQSLLSSRLLSKIYKTTCCFVWV
jgi:hypothetical protein